MPKEAAMSTPIPEMPDHAVEPDDDFDPDQLDASALGDLEREDRAGE